MEITTKPTTTIIVAAQSQANSTNCFKRRNPKE
jgi:hypothetical protein